MNQDLDIAPNDYKKGQNNLGNSAAIGHPEKLDLFVARPANGLYVDILTNQNMC